MPGAKVRVIGDRLHVDGHGDVYPSGYAELAASIEVLGPASLASFRNALRKWSARHYRHAMIWVADMPSEKFRDPDMAVREDVEFMFFNDELTVLATTYGDPADGLPDAGAVEKLIRPLLARYGATATVGVDDDESDFGGLYQLGFEITIPIRNRTVYDAYQLGKDVIALSEAADGGGRPLSRDRTLDLLRSGRVDVLLGLEEGDWIDFKRKAYTPKSDAGRLELAKDVATFANASGGLLILGVATRKDGHLEIASKILPCPAGTVSVLSYRSAIHRRVYPRPSGVEIFPIPHGAHGDIWVVSVPPQPDSLKPFLVHGAVFNSAINDNYFSIVTRVADEAVPTAPQAVHSLLVAGRAALQVRPRRRNRKTKD